MYISVRIAERHEPDWLLESVANADRACIELVLEASNWVKNMN